ncbi:3-hydroxybutyryl-CoA dehydrogenase [Ornithinimicrobium pekingense]|uniref:3-hydroxybutyryl-CoA dehydrogenase n=1 Tax=Ornithinimicrobium pekingense TaxID=384677 RepID=A0ABQ2F750_9MICO|nr:3-hydroxybutyryl-CoA dehydrogenase [Ornithinimicrobium pekingense]GGK59716.1 3-hydroxybutyryl-CoA dehydrogenase [Ornithinimicrobium pekingense]
MREISTVGVIGLGTMGAGIVEVFARGGLRVVGVETTQEYAERGRAILQGSTDRAVAKGRLDEAGQAQILDRVTISTDLADLKDADLVVEAVPEVMSLKHEVFGRLDEICDAGTILASNTSSLSITEIAGPTKHPGRVVGLHFFNPAPVLKLVEVITTVRSDQAVVDSVVELSRSMGKKPVVVGDRAGFVANYLLFGYFTSALRMLEHGHVSREDLDTAMRVGAGLPMGPLTLVDLVGLDVCHHIGDVIYNHTRSPMHAPSAMLGRMVTAGLLGRKSGRGFYTYDRPGGGTVVADAQTPPQPEPTGVTSVGVVGTGEVADDLAERLENGGYAVVHVTEAADSEALAALADVGVVIEAQDLDTEVDDLDGLELGEPASAGDPVEDLLPGRDIDDLFAELGEITGPGTVLTTVNSAAAVALGALSGRPGRCLALRVHAPTNNGQVIEIGRTSVTDDDAVAVLRELVTKVGAEPVVCRDRAGLVVDALLVPHLNDAVRMLDEGYATVEDIDTATQFGLGYPMGPFAMIDHIGADDVLAVCEELASGSSGLPRESVEASPLLVEHVILDRPFTS